MNLKKKISSAVIFLVASIIFVSATPLANNVFAQTEGEEDSSTTNYENFQNCLSNASGMYNVPSGDQIVNCFAESGYVQGSSSTSNAADTENESENIIKLIGEIKDIFMQNMFKGKCFKSKSHYHSDPMIGFNL